jgi:predicted DCC family thiol-disulfide oxidoreductase YuxK
VRVPRPVFFFDGECGFCRRWVNRWRVQVGERADFVALQEAVAPPVPVEELKKASHLLLPDGTVHRGAAAVFELLALAPGSGVARAAYRALPPFAAVSEAAYALVAAHRVAASRVTRALVGANLEPKTFRLTRSIFLRLVGVVFLIAFASLRVQILGLIGSHGISPAHELLSALTERYGASVHARLPTVFWSGDSDAALTGVCDAGIVCSLLLIAGIAAPWMLLVLWALYLSIVSVGDVFLGYQWDALLLETSVLALLLGPSHLLLHRSRGSPPVAAIWLLRLLLFKLMYLSGEVKLSSHDPAWAGCTALRYHYWTQPLPAWTSWYASHFPGWLQTLSCRVMFVIELRVPFLVFGPRRVRQLAFALLVFLQLAILATGNYGFFNLLAIVLCVPLLDDQAWLSLVPARWRRAPRPARDRTRLVRLWWLATRAAVAVAGLQLLIASVYTMRSRMGSPPPSIVEPLLERTERYGAVSSYGLFSVMTTTRPEILVEGSDDGVTWKPYEFRWKPGRLNEAPRFVAPHQPRLDWQMWFAALEDCRSNEWLLSFQKRLLEGEPVVTHLLGSNPFPDAPPKFLRTTLWQYRFSTRAEARADGNWWEREPAGDYCPELTLVDGELSPVK